MDRYRTALVLGAGASCNYGYPTGFQLRQGILALQKTGGVEQNAANMSVSIEDLTKFITEFRLSQRYSIDAFLGRRMEFEAVGKAAIAHVLLRCEAEHASSLLDDTLNDHWYQYLVNVLTIDEWDDLDLSWICIITFNYDRSLEQFLQLALESIYAKSPGEVRKKLQTLRIIHVYGDLGSIWSDEGGYEYGERQSPFSGRIQTGAKRLRIIAEGRNDERHLVECRDLLSAAERICFLGFGFDSVNLQRLGAPNVFQAHSTLAKQIDATALGLTTNEQRQAAARLVGLGAFNNGVASRFRSSKCKELLRQSLVLEAEFDQGIIIPGN